MYEATVINYLLITANRMEPQGFKVRDSNYLLVCTG